MYLSSIENNVITLVAFEFTTCLHVISFLKTSHEVGQELLPVYHIK